MEEKKQKKRKKKVITTRGIRIRRFQKETGSCMQARLNSQLIYNTFIIKLFNVHQFFLRPFWLKGNFLMKKKSLLLPSIARTPLKSVRERELLLCLIKVHMTPVYFQISIRHFTYRFPYKGIFQGLTILQNGILSFNDSMRTP